MEQCIIPQKLGQKLEKIIKNSLGKLNDSRLLMSIQSAIQHELDYWYSCGWQYKAGFSLSGRCLVNVVNDPQDPMRRMLKVEFFVNGEPVELVSGHVQIE